MNNARMIKVLLGKVKLIWPTLRKRNVGGMARVLASGIKTGIINNCLPKQVIC
jgi:hypothetical protein